jgi:AmmeMemoRadiSam system protein B
MVKPHHERTSKAPLFLMILAVLLASCTASPEMMVRNPIKAGILYSDDGGRLTKQLDEIFAQCGASASDGTHTAKLAQQNSSISAPVLALIVPHANFAFSGLAAARAFRTLATADTKRVFILGPDHSGKLHGAGLSAAHYFATPLGNVPVDTDAVNQLMGCRLFSVNNNAHKQEYSIEMQLPFVCHQFPDVKIVPILIGKLSASDDAGIIADALVRLLRPGDVVIVSSDLTHYGQRYHFQPTGTDVIQRLDRRAYEFIQHLDTNGFFAFRNQTGDPICGCEAIGVLMRMLPSGTQVSLLDYYTSQDVIDANPRLSLTAHPNFCVSYAAVAFSAPSWATQNRR